MVSDDALGRMHKEAQPQIALRFYVSVSSFEPGTFQTKTKSAVDSPATFRYRGRNLI
jgi:hypothetical protein